MERYLTDYIRLDLEKKMVFMGGPRQSGKTTLARNLLKDQIALEAGGAYFNWDSDIDRKVLLNQGWSDDQRLLIFDELHKFRRWKTWIKGLYDTNEAKHKFLVTGSARLDVYKRGGDSLLGRYHYWRLHPFCLAELPPGISAKEGLKRLMSVGGFPEPFIDGNEREARRWRRDRIDRILREDVRDLESIKEISTLDLFHEALKTRVGGLVTLSNIANDLQISPTTAKKWLEVLEKMYVCFTVLPLTNKIARAIKKPPKVFFFDNADVPIEKDEGARFENLVASHLLKRLHLLEDRDGFRYKLHYIRDKEGREVDFAIIKDGKLEELIEVKLGDASPSRSLLYYAERLKPKRAVQIVLGIKRSVQKGSFLMTTPEEYFKGFD